MFLPRVVQKWGNISETLNLKHVSHFSIYAEMLSTRMLSTIEDSCIFLVHQKLDVNFGTELATECDESPVEVFLPTVAGESQDATTEPYLAKSISVSSISSGPTLVTSVRKWSPGFQPEVVCQQITGDPVPNITCVALSSAYGM